MLCYSGSKRKYSTPDTNVMFTVVANKKIPILTPMLNICYSGSK